MYQKALYRSHKALTCLHLFVLIVLVNKFSRFAVKRFWWWIEWFCLCRWYLKRDCSCAVC